MQVVEAYTTEGLSTQQASLITDCLVCANVRNGSQIDIVLVATGTANEDIETCSLVLDYIGRIRLFHACGKNCLTSIGVEIILECIVTLSSSSEVFCGHILKENLVGCVVSLKESLSCSRFYINRYRINLELRNVEVGKLRVVVGSSQVFCERIELDIATAVSTISVSHREAQIAVGTTQVDRLAGSGS